MAKGTTTTTVPKSSSTRRSSSSSSSSYSCFSLSWSNWALALLSCGISFYGGTLYTLHDRMKHCMDLDVSSSRSSSSNSGAMMSAAMNKDEWSVLEQERLKLESNIRGLYKDIFRINSEIEETKKTKNDAKKKKKKKKIDNKAKPPPPPNQNKNEKQKEFVFPLSTQRYMAGVVRMKKTRFLDTFRIGIPIDQLNDNSTDILVFYNRENAMPNNYTELISSSSSQQQQQTPIASVDDVLRGFENCDFLNVILTRHNYKYPKQQQCIAIVPQYESFTLYRYGRIPPRAEKRDGGGGGKPLPVNRSSELRAISRGMLDNGVDEFEPPKRGHIQKHFEILQNFLKHSKVARIRLGPVLNSIAVKNTVVVLVCNFGQSELLMNFVCAAKTRNLNLSPVIVFATDRDTQELAESLGLSTFYDENLFGTMPHHEAKTYGDPDFVSMMFGKIICVQLVNMLGFDLLFQDVDVVWYKHPLDDYFHTEEFENTMMKEYDVFFQNDGQYSVRYAPYSANSGFYYVQHNPMTLYFFTSMMTQAGGHMIKSNSHQEILIGRLNEFVSLFGMRVKILDREPHSRFPAGFHFHRQDDGGWFRDFFAGNEDPIALHMSWTTNKHDKILFFKQIGEWYIQNDAMCVQKQKDDIIASSGGSNNVLESCCAPDPIVSCHFRDKPSIVPCHDSPPHVKGKKSWWNT